MIPWGLGALVPALAVIVLLFFGVLGVVLVRTRAPHVHAPAVSPAEFGPESPAEVDFVVSGGHLQPEAASATLLDLAARQVVDVEEIGPSMAIVHVRLTPLAVELAPYEDLVLQRVRMLEVDGAVATGALAEASAGLSRWWRQFAKAVTDECRANNLCHARFAAGVRTVLAVVGVVSSGAAGILAWLIAVRLTKPDEDSPPIIGAIFVAFAVYLGLTKVWRHFDVEVLTQTGAEAAARWLAVRSQLAADSGLRSLPAAAVTIRGRPMAYAAALGLAKTAVEGLPVAMVADASHAWSDYSGLWRRVDVSYAHGGMLLSIGPPMAVAARGLYLTFFVGVWVWIGLLLARLAWRDMPAGSAVPVAVIAAACVALMTVGRVLLDALTPKTVQGEIIRRVSRLRSTRGGNQSNYYWLAIDDGRSAASRACLCAYSVWNAAAEGDVVQVVTYRRCRWIKQLTTLKPSRFRGAFN